MLLRTIGTPIPIEDEVKMRIPLIAGSALVAVLIVHASNVRPLPLTRRRMLTRKLESRPKLSEG